METSGESRSTAEPGRGDGTLAPAGQSAGPGGPGGATADATGASESDIPPVPERRLRQPSVRVFRAIKAQHAADRTIIERFADLLTGIASSTPFLLLHIAWFLIWIPWNTGLLGLRPFDPFPFGLLTMIVSLEAIFLSIFVLMGQRRESAIAELREEVTLRVTLQMEQEVTKTLQLVAGLYTRLGHRVGQDPELHEMLQPLDPREIEHELIEQIWNRPVRRRVEES